MDNQSTPLRFGILSTANIAIAMVNQMHECAVTSPFAVASRDLDKAKLFARNHRIERSYGSYDELLQDADVDAVYIPLPTSLKAQWAIRTANAGKHVLCDKPIGSANDVRLILDACRRNGVHFMDNTMFVHSDVNTQLRSHELTSHLFTRGTLQRVHNSLSFHLTDRSNIRLSAELEPMGAIGDLAWYNVRNILWAFSYERPLSVRATALLDRETGVPVRCDAWIWFSDDRIASFNCSFNEAKRQHAEYVTCDHVVHHSAFMNDDPGHYTVDGVTVEAKTNKPRIIRLLERFALDAKQPGSDHARQWGEETLLNMTVLDAIMESVRTGDKVEL